MKKLILSVNLLLILFTIGCNEFKENTVDSPKNGKFEVISIPAPSLANNIIGEDTVKNIGIYLPPSYENSNKKYPVIYWLDGFSVAAGQYPATNDLDSSILNQTLKECIWVEISGKNKLNGSFYKNSPVTGNWEDFIINDVISYIDSNYRTLAKKESRALAGHSMGGAGTLNLALSSQDIFSLVMAFSPGIFDSLGIYNTGIFSTNKDIERLFAFEKNAPKERPFDDCEKYFNDFNFILALSWGATYSPDTSKNSLIKLPYYVEGTDTIMDKEVMQKWQNGLGDWENKVAANKENLLQYKFLGIDCGYNDHLHWIYDGSVNLGKILDKNQIPYSLTLHDGGHSDKVSNQIRTNLFPKVSAILEFE